jgi:hypothetical protein
MPRFPETERASMRWPVLLLANTTLPARGSGARPVADSGTKSKPLNRQVPCHPSNLCSPFIATADLPNSWEPRIGSRRAAVMHRTGLPILGKGFPMIIERTHSIPVPGPRKTS